MLPYDVFFTFFDVMQSSIEVPTDNDVFGFRNAIDGSFEFFPCCYASRLLNGEHGVVGDVSSDDDKWISMHGEFGCGDVTIDLNVAGAEFFKTVSKAEAYSPVVFVV